MVNDVKLRPGTPEDAFECGRICYEAFGAIATEHNFQAQFGSVDETVGLMKSLLSNEQINCLVAEQDGVVRGSCFVTEGVIATGGPLSVDPAVQNSSIGRMLAETHVAWLLERGVTKGIRLTQAAWHSRALALYAKLGFVVREPLGFMQGAALGVSIDGYPVRPATTADIEACNQVCRTVHGHDRGWEVADGVGRQTALVVEHGGRVTGYSTGVPWLGHSVGESTEDIKALIGAADGLYSGILVPLRNAELFRFCLGHGLHLGQVLTLMTIGLYNEPMGAYLPSNLFLSLPVRMPADATAPAGAGAG